MNKKKSSSSRKASVDHHHGTSNSANENERNNNNAGNRNLPGIEEGMEEAASDGVPFILVDAIMPLTQCPLIDPELAQVEARRMAQVLAECDQLLERLEDTQPPPELHLPSTMTMVENVDGGEKRFLEELQQLCIFPSKSEAPAGQIAERPGLSRQATFDIDRGFPSLSERRHSSCPESKGIINQIGDLLVRLKQLQQQQPLEQEASCFFLVSIKPEAETSNCFVQQIGVPPSCMPPVKESLVPPQKESLLQPVKESLLQPVMESFVPPVKESLLQLAEDPHSASSEILIQIDTNTSTDLPLPSKASISRSKSRFGFVGRDAN